MYPSSRIYGLDIETDTRVNGLDPRIAPVVAIAVSSARAEIVIRGSGAYEAEEPVLLQRLGAVLAALPAGLLVTWGGSYFDLPFLHDRARHCGVELGLRIEHDLDIELRYPPLPGHPGAYQGSWERRGTHHAHLDVSFGFRPLADHHGTSCALKPISRLLGLQPVEVDRERIHELPPRELDAYVSSDARCTREAAGLLLAGRPLYS